MFAPLILDAKLPPMSDSPNSPSILNRLKGRVLERDKQQHAAISYGLVVVLFFLGASLTAAMAGTLMIGLAKEIWDKHHGSGFCWYDMLANALGIAAGAATVLAFTG